MSTDTLDRPAAKDDGFRIDRSILIQTQASTPFHLVNDFHNWVRWSPYEGLDPKLQRGYGGPDQGVGAVYVWQGDNRVGHGRMEIVASEAPRLIRIKLDFYRPFEAHNTAEFSFIPEGDGVRVTWAMFGPSTTGNPVVKFVMGLFFNMEKMVGGQFETGLKKLKAVAEAKA